LTKKSFFSYKKNKESFGKVESFMMLTRRRLFSKAEPVTKLEPTYAEDFFIIKLKVLACIDLIHIFCRDNTYLL